MVLPGNYVQECFGDAYRQVCECGSAQLHKGYRRKFAKGGLFLDAWTRLEAKATAYTMQVEEYAF